MPFRILSLIFGVLLGCSSSPSKPSGLVDHRRVQVINFQNEFQQFWKAAEAQPFERQLALWTRVVEQPHREFYDEFVWHKQDPPGNYDERRAKVLRAAFASYKKNGSRIVDNFASFDKTLAAQVARFRSVFPNAEFPITVYAAAAPTFLGHAGTLPQSKAKVLAFSIDRLTIENINLDVVYSHELFHIYHSEKSGIVDDDRIQATYPLTIALWAEGLATSVSRELNPQASNLDIFLYEQLADLPEAQITRLARAFLNIARTPAYNAKDPEPYSNWFLTTKTFGGGYPPSAGYWLGYKVVEILRKQYDLRQMSQWNVKKADAAVMLVLNDLAYSHSASR